MTQPCSWYAIQHVPFERPGLIGAEADRRGLPLAICRTYLGDRLPTLTEIDGLIVMGGPMSVHDVDEHPHLVGELGLLVACVRAGIPVLGVCLGCQLLAQALGGHVYRGDRPEIGPGTVALTANGDHDPVLGATTHRHSEGYLSDASELAVIHWHQDTFELPPDATRLAGSDLFENQAFRVGQRAYGFQFHVEVDRSLAKEWTPRLPEGLEIGKTTRATVERAGRRVIKAFFDMAQG